MVLKIIALVFGYLLCGVGVLELVKLHDRKVDWEHEWLYGSDDVEDMFVVILFPIMLIPLILMAVIKGIQIVFTTIVYTIVALIRGRNDTGTDR